MVSFHISTTPYLASVSTSAHEGQKRTTNRPLVYTGNTMYLCKHVCVCVCVCVRVCACACAHACIHTYVCMHASVYVHMYIDMCVFMYVFVCTHTQTYVCNTSSTVMVNNCLWNTMNSSLSNPLNIKRHHTETRNSPAAARCKNIRILTNIYVHLYIILTHSLIH